MFRLSLLMCATSALAACSGPAIEITAIDHTPLREGLGCAIDGCEQVCTADGCEGGRRPPVVMVTTTEPVTAARAHLEGSDAPVLVDVLARSGDTTALAVRIPVNSGLPLGDRALVLEVDGGDSTATTADDPTLALTALGLDELVVSGPLPPAASTATYSSIVVPTAIVASLDGDVAVRLLSTTDIEMAGIISVDATADRPGPGGCAGQASADAPARCAPGQGTSTDGNGGDAGSGGFGTAGGGGAGLGGAATGNPMILPLGAFGPPGVPVTPDVDNRGHGGGAHGDTPGGHGGGGVLLWANGRISLGQYARVTARGSAPAITKGPSAGAGSGGAIIVSADAGISVAAAATMPFEATGGSGPGAGGLGRIRLDGAEDGFARATPAPWAGPAWIDPPLVVGAEVQLTLRVDPRWTQDLRFLIEGRANPVTCTPSAGMCRVTVQPPIGLTRVCAALGTGFMPPPDLTENGTCVELARVE